MDREDILNEFKSIKKRLNELLDCYQKKKISYYDYMKLKKEVYNLYRDYLKLYVIYSGNKVLSSDSWPYQNNCFYYALNLPTPDIFVLTYDKMFLDSFYLDLGVISNLPLLDDREFTLNTFLYYVYSDLDTLNIKYYPSTINSEIKHDGYKIALFYDEDNRDYHIIRENNDGLWSQKHGLMDIISIVDNPLDFLNNHPYDISGYSKYEYVQTLELVKPSIK